MDINNKILSDITVFMKYAKYLPKEQRRETWEELVDRNMQMHIKKYPQLEEEILEAYKLVLEKKVLPSMRSLQFAGKPIEITPNRLYNCAYLPVDDWRAFQEIMFCLLCGNGVGLSVQKHHIELLPDITKPNPNRTKRYLVGDSVEGWSDAIKLLMKSYFFGGPTIAFDFRDIRPKGAKLITSGGKAPGPQPLIECVVKIKGILESKEEGSQLSPLEVHDIVCHIADAVLAGGIRRSALISLFSADDMEMISCKSGNWWELNPQRGRSNNSASLVRHRITEDFFMNLWDRIKASGAGEPGIFFTNDKDWGTNPCCFIGDTLIETDNGSLAIKDIVESINNGGSCKVKTYNEQTGTLQYDNVITGCLTQKGAIVTGMIVHSNENYNKVICTPDHKFYTINRGWIECKDLIPDDILLMDDLTDGKVILHLEPETYDVYDIEVENNHNFFANGILAHNCEISLRPNQFCNLTEVNVSDIESQEDLNERVRVASFIGTLQAGYTDFHYLRPVWEKTTKKDALLGVSMTGIGSGVIFNYDLKESAEIAKVENARIADLIGINKAARITAVKPSGTASCVLGTSSGIHAWHNDYYIRRLRVGKNEGIYTYLSIHHPELVEDEYFRPHDTAVINIPQKAPDGSILRTESALDLLKRVKLIHNDWIKGGHRNGSNQHNISATISIKNDEWDEVGVWMWKNRKSYNGLSVLPYDGGTYIQAPFEDITEEQYNEMVSHLHNIDLSRVIELDDETNLQGEVACAGGSCEII